MNANLGAVLEQFVTDPLKSGLYPPQSEVVREGLRLLKEREELKKLRRDELREQIALGRRRADRRDLVNDPGAF